MIKALTVALLLFSSQLIAAAPNCAWSANTGSGSFHAEDTIDALDACSLIVRSTLLYNFWREPRNLAEVSIGRQLNGTLTFASPSDGTVVRCETVTVKDNPNPLTDNEWNAIRLKADLDQPARTPKELEVGREWLLFYNVNLQATEEKINSSLRLSCDTSPTS